MQEEQGIEIWDSVCGIFHDHVPSLLTFEGKYAGQVKKMQKFSEDSVSCLLSCVSWMLACSGPFRGEGLRLEPGRRQHLGVVCLAEGKQEGRQLPRSPAGCFTSTFWSQW